LSNIILGGITLPSHTTLPKLDFSPVVLYSEPSITGRLHNVYLESESFENYGNYDTIRFNRKFTFEIIGLTYAEWVSINAIDGSNCTLRFERDIYTEEYEGNLDCTFFKFDEHNYFDAVSIEFTVTEQNPTIPTIMFFGHMITTPPVNNNSLMFIGDEI